MKIKKMLLPFGLVALIGLTALVGTKIYSAVFWTNQVGTITLNALTVRSMGYRIASVAPGVAGNPTNSSPTSEENFEFNDIYLGQQGPDIINGKKDLNRVIIFQIKGFFPGDTIRFVRKINEGQTLPIANGATVKRPLFKGGDVTNPTIVPNDGPYMLAEYTIHSDEPTIFTAGGYTIQNGNILAYTGPSGTEYKLKESIAGYANNIAVDTTQLYHNCDTTGDYTKPVPWNPSSPPGTCPNGSNSGAEATTAGYSGKGGAYSTSIHLEIDLL